MITCEATAYLIIEGKVYLVSLNGDYSLTIPIFALVLSRLYMVSRLFVYVSRYFTHLSPMLGKKVSLLIDQQDLAEFANFPFSIRTISEMFQWRVECRHVQRMEEKEIIRVNREREREKN